MTEILSYCETCKSSQPMGAELMGKIDAIPKMDKNKFGLYRIVCMKCNHLNLKKYGTENG